MKGNIIALCMAVPLLVHGLRPVGDQTSMAAPFDTTSSLGVSVPYSIEAESPFNLNYLSNNTGLEGEILFEFLVRTDFDTDDWADDEAPVCWSDFKGCCVPLGRLTMQLAPECTAALTDVLLDGKKARWEKGHSHVAIHGLEFWGTAQCSYTNQFVTLVVQGGRGCPPAHPHATDSGNATGSGDSSSGAAENRHGEGSPCPRGGCRYRFEGVADESAHGGSTEATVCLIEGNSYPWSWQPGHLFTQQSAKERCPLTAFAGDDPSAVRFYAFGDWGAELNGEATKVDQFGNQARVSIAMNEQAAWFKPQFILSLGDNFYEEGLSASNDPAKKLVWKDMYDTFPNLEPLHWYATLGNHDYGPLKGKPEACRREHLEEAHRQFEGCTAAGGSHEACAAPLNRYYSPRWQYTDVFGDPQWTLWNGTYSVPLGDVEIFVIDTTPIRIKADMDHGYETPHTLEYRGDAPFGLSQQDADLAVRQLEELLAKSNATVKILAGHDGWEGYGKHGSTSYVRKSFDDTLQRIIREHGIKIYIHAHDHIMQVCREAHGNHPTHHITSGSVYRTRPAIGKKAVAKHNTDYERLWYSTDPNDPSEEPTTDSGFAAVAVQGRQIVYSMWSIRGGCQFEQVLHV